MLTIHRIIRALTTRKVTSHLLPAVESGLLKNVTAVFQNYPQHATAELEQEDELGFTPLYLACIGNKYNIMLYLLEKGANPYHIANNGNSLLHSAITAYYLNLIKLLVWFCPDFQHIPSPDSKTAALRIQIWHERTRFQGVAYEILLTTKSGIDFRNKTQEGNLQLTKQDYFEAALCFIEAADLCYQQSITHANIDKYLKKNEISKDLQEILID